MFIPESPPVKGKLIIEALDDGTYRFRAAITFKGIGTLSRFGDTYRVERQEDGFLTIPRDIKLTLKNITLTTHYLMSNAEESYEWKPVGEEEVKDKYLERELQSQLK